MSYPAPPPVYPTAPPIYPESSPPVAYSLPPAPYPGQQTYVYTTGAPLQPNLQYPLQQQSIVYVQAPPVKYIQQQAPNIQQYQPVQYSQPVQYVQQQGISLFRSSLQRIGTLPNQ